MPTAAPRDAATVALLRDGAGGVEVFLLRRVAGMAFAGGMTVFPGGSVDPSDRAGQPRWIGADPAQWTDVLTADESTALAVLCAAVRETFEESGVLLAGSRDRTIPGSEVDRLRIERHELSLGELLDRMRLSLRADLLRAWTHWITPESEPRRYDTRFFVAALPVGQRTRDVSSEAEVAEWVRPADALAQHDAGDRPMMPPTVVTLRELAGFGDVAAVWAAATGRDIAPILPRLRGSEVVLPGGDTL